ncbi:MAG: hypothetical protein IK143_01365 [Bacteroidales bacterium]|nr:hypothetical protein [Bacteroidales bacterium]
MKRIIAIAAILILSAWAAFGQAQINTRKFRLQDFKLKTTKVVLSGHEAIDNALMKDITERWNLSPFEFCSLEEFEELRIYDAYYFLLLADSPSGPEGESGITFLTLVKGGEEASKGIKHMLEVVSVPFAPAGGMSVRSLLYLPALIDIVQDFVPRAMDKAAAGYAGLNSYSKNLLKSRNKRIYLSEDDLDDNVTEKVLARLDSDIIVTSEDEVDNVYNARTYNTLVSYVVAPVFPWKGAECYKMLIEADTHTLYYYRRSKLSGKSGAGFAPDDIKRLSAGR